MPGVSATSSTAAAGTHTSSAPRRATQAAVVHGDLGLRPVAEPVGADAREPVARERARHVQRVERAEHDAAARGSAGTAGGVGTKPAERRTSRRRPTSTSVSRTTPSTIQIPAATGCGRFTLPPPTGGDRLDGRSVEHGGPAAQERRDDRTGQLAALEGRVGARGGLPGAVDHAPRGRVDERDVRGLADLEADGPGRAPRVDAADARGALDSTRATSAHVMRPVSTMVCCTTLSAVSRPVMPNAAAAHSQSLSSRACGAWSVATMSIVPSARPSRTASTSAAVRSGGLTLKVGS